ncbi:hypothetical protein HBB16_21505 [Pseudonocardia sp. MCCB 268]|nr:hypothetical protein [Pseudonocardia cytotoxica]
MLACLVGGRVRAVDAVTAATVTASARSVSVRARGRGGSPRSPTRPALCRRRPMALPLARRPRLTVRAARAAVARRREGTEMSADTTSRWRATGAGRLQPPDDTRAAEVLSIPFVVVCLTLAIRN